MESAKTQLSAIYPHTELITPLQPLGLDEIRVISLLPGDNCSPLKARFSTLRVERNHDDSTRRVPEPAELLSNKWVKVKNNLYQVGLDYDGNGAEFGDPEVSDIPFESSYEAISYVWGEPVYSHGIELEGHGVLRITESLSGALRRFRSSDCERRLWADAICINQADIEERSAQVAIMARVYQCARKVLVWLGPADRLDALAFAAVPAYLEARELGGGLEELWQNFKTVLYATIGCPCCSESLEHLWTEPFEALLAIGHLLDRPWFSRLWVMQEVYGRTLLEGRATVFCGSHSMPYMDLRDASEAIGSDTSPRGVLQAIAKLPEHALKRIRLAWSTPKFVGEWFSYIDDLGPSYMLRALAAMSRRDCSDPRDRVYAVRAMLNLEQEPSLLPDYRLPQFEVYRRLIRVFLDKFKQRDDQHIDQPWAILALAGTYSEASCSFDEASWVPNLHALTDRSRAKIELYTRVPWLEVPQFIPSANLFCGGIRENGDHWLLRARCFATIAMLFPDTEYPVLQETHSDHISNADLSTFRSWYTRCLSHIDVPSSADEVVISHSTSFLACNIQLALLPREMEDVEEATDFSNGWLMPDQWPDDHNVVREHFMLLCASSQNPPDKSRIIARIKVPGDEPIDDFCWVPPQAMPGDQVFVVAGAPFPFILRQQPENRFKVLGDGFLANTTLKRALGGKGKWRFEEDIYEEIDHPVNDIWNVEDEEMKMLIDAMDEIAIV